MLTNCVFEILNLIYIFYKSEKLELDLNKLIFLMPQNAYIYVLQILLKALSVLFST